tara:strand:+ start:126 stop:383 length:258 start_codon:yes stop_codon:yes gene_type:complete
MFVSIHPVKQALVRAQQADPKYGATEIQPLFMPASSLRALFGSNKSPFLTDITIPDHEKWPGYTFFWGECCCYNKLASRDKRILP